MRTGYALLGADIFPRSLVQSSELTISSTLISTPTTEICHNQIQQSLKKIHFFNIISVPKQRHNKVISSISSTILAKFLCISCLSLLLHIPLTSLRLISFTIYMVKTANCVASCPTVRHFLYFRPIKIDKTPIIVNLISDSTV